MSKYNDRNLTIRDIVCATKQAPYSITNERMKRAIITELTGDKNKDIVIRVLEHYDKAYIGKDFKVASQFFKKIGRSNE